MTITFNPRKVVTLLGGIVIVLILANFVAIISAFYFNRSNLLGFVPLFRLGYEKNIPTLYSSVTMLLCSGFLAIIAIAKKRLAKNNYFYWAGLAAIFLFLSADEFATIHERLITPLRERLGTSGIFYFAWVIPYGILGILLFLIYFRFLLSLPAKMRNLMILAGVIYVAGALGFEMIDGYWYELHGADIIYVLMTTLEETLEMVGILVFIYALMSYIEVEFLDLSFRISSSARSDPG